MKLVILCLAMLLGGCVAMVYPLNLKALEKACEAHGGWAMIDPRTVLTARCVDGTYITDLSGTSND